MGTKRKGEDSARVCLAGVPVPSGNEYWLCAQPGIYQLTVNKNLGEEQRVGRILARRFLRAFLSSAISQTCVPPPASPTSLKPC